MITERKNALTEIFKKAKINSRKIDTDLSRLNKEKEEEEGREKKKDSQKELDKRDGKI